MWSLFVGCGYVGRQVAHRERDGGGSAGAVVRTSASAAVLGAEGIAAVSADLDTEITFSVPVADRVLCWLAPPPPDGSQDLRLRNLTRRLLADGQAPSRVTGACCQVPARGPSVGATMGESAPARTGRSNPQGVWVHRGKVAAPRNVAPGAGGVQGGGLIPAVSSVTSVPLSARNAALSPECLARGATRNVGCS